MDNNNIQQQLYQQQRSNKKYFAVIIILLLVIGVSVGYAVLSANFGISGTSKIKDSDWSVGLGDVDPVCTDPDKCSTVDTQQEFNDAEPGEGEGVFWMDGNTVYFKHLLVQPGDTFTFTTTYTNSGDIDAKVGNVSITNFSGVAASFLDYTVTYSDNSAVAVGNVLSAKQSAVFKVTVTYKDVNTLPTAEQLAAINASNGAVSSFTITYEQA